MTRITNYIVAFVRIRIALLFGRFAKILDCCSQATQKAANALDRGAAILCPEIIELQ